MFVRNDDSCIVIIDSKRRVSGTPGNFKSNILVNSNATHMILLECQLPATYYNNYRDSVIHTNSGDFILRKGNYNQLNIANTLSTLLSATVTYSNITMKLTSSIPVMVDEPDIAELLGLNIGIFYNGEFPNATLLMDEQNISISINLSNPQRLAQLLDLNIGSGTVTYSQRNPYCEMVPLTTPIRGGEVITIDITIHNEDGRVLDFNGNNSILKIMFFNKNLSNELDNIIRRLKLLSV